MDIVCNGWEISKEGIYELGFALTEKKIKEIRNVKINNLRIT